MRVCSYLSDSYFCHLLSAEIVPAGGIIQKTLQEILQVAEPTENQMKFVFILEKLLASPEDTTLKHVVNRLVDLLTERQTGGTGVGDANTGLDDLCADFENLSSDPSAHSRSDQESLQNEPMEVSGSSQGDKSPVKKMPKLADEESTSSSTFGIQLILWLTDTDALVNCPIMDKQHFLLMSTYV